MSEPERVIESLLTAGWSDIGGRAGLYRRLAVVEERGNRLTMTVPLDASYDDYEDLMGAVLSTLERLRFDGQTAQVALARINPEVYG